MSFENILFDLDGTIINSEVGVTSCVVYALKKFGIEETDRALLRKFLGPPLSDSFMRFYGFDAEKAEKAVAYYRERYVPVGVHENEVYEGVPELLSELRAAGKKLYIATSKPEHFAKGILAELSLDKYFDGVFGSTLDESRNTKDKVLAYAINEIGLDKSRSVMIGDRFHDVEGATVNGLPCVGVLYGFGDREELLGAGAITVAETPLELLKILLEENKMEKIIAKDLLKIKAVFFRPEEPFTWASGIKSPVYCDNRLTLTAPEVRNDVENGLAELIKKHYPEAEVLMGTSTAGIAHAAITAHLMGLPMGYVRSGAKDHGRQNQIEGKLEKGQKVVVVEDLISTGGSVIEVVNVLREAGAEVLGIVSIFTYGMKKGLERLAAAEVKNVSLTNFDVIAETAADEGYIKPEDVKRLIAFRNNPSDESWIKA